MAARGFLGAGDLYINRYVGGAKVGITGPYECKRFEIKPNVDVKEASSKGRDTYGQVIESVALPQPAEFTINLGEVNKESMTLALLGTAAALTQASGNLTAVDVTAKLDVWVPLTKASLTGLATVTNTGATTTYVEGTDYLLNRRMGWIKALSTGDIAADEALKLTSAYGAISATRISGNTAGQVRAEFILDGINFADSLPCIVTVHEGVIAADSAFDFLAGEFTEVSLPGKMKTPAGKTEPFTVDLHETA